MRKRELLTPLVWQPVFEDLAGHWLNSQRGLCWTGPAFRRTVGGAPGAQPHKGDAGGLGRRGQASDCSPPAHRAMHTILWTWLDQYSDHFFQPPHFPGLKLLLGYVQVNYPAFNLEHRAQLLLQQLKKLEDPETSEEEWEEEEEEHEEEEEQEQEKEKEKLEEEEEEQEEEEEEKEEVVTCEMESPRLQTSVSVERTH